MVPSPFGFRQPQLKPSLAWRLLRLKVKRQTLAHRVQPAVCSMDHIGRHMPPHVQGGVGADDDAQQDDGDDQRLFTVYVHDKTGSPEYEPGDVYFGHRIGQRVEVCDCFFRALPCHVKAADSAHQPRAYARTTRRSCYAAPDGKRM